MPEHVRARPARRARTRTPRRDPRAPPRPPRRKPARPRSPGSEVHRRRPHEARHPRARRAAPRPRPASRPAPRRPSRSTATRWPSASASPWSCVTCSVVTPVPPARAGSPRAWTPAAARRGSTAARRAAARAGRAASARASATRWRSPPDSSPGRRSSMPVEPQRLRGPRTRAASPPVDSRARPQPERDVALHGQVREQREALEDHRHAALARARRRATSSPPINTRPPWISSSPAIARSSVDFPEPEAPSTATSSPGATARESSRNASTPP